MKVSGREVYPERQSREALAGQRKRKITYIQIAANQEFVAIFTFKRGAHGILLGQAKFLFSDFMDCTKGARALTQGIALRD
jgi:hypothetical protein